uniref:Uncharacterized protein n=1 Tax=Noctiluca scintillans TaxID=2966 RepID=A0A7S1AZL2_NOCSC
MPSVGYAVPQTGYGAQTVSAAFGTQPAAVGYSGATSYSASPYGVRSASFVPAVAAAPTASYGQLPMATSMVASPYGQQAYGQQAYGQQAYGQQAALAPAQSMAAVSPYGQQAMMAPATSMAVPSYGQQAMMVPATSMAVSPYGQQVPAGYGATPGYGFEQQVAAPGYGQYGQEVGYATQYGDAPVYYTDATPTKRKKKGGVCC